MDEESLTQAVEPIELLDLCKSTALRFNDEAYRKDIRLSVFGEELIVLGVPALMREIIYNLCDNAIKYNGNEGSVEIEVKRSDGMATIIVSDTGIGIPKAQQDCIFERFYRGNTSRSSEIRGTGLGYLLLNIVLCRITSQYNLKA